MGQPLPEEPDAEGGTTESMIMPALSYTSDLGLVIGGSFSRYRLKEGYDPYYSLFNIDLLASIRGMLLSRVEYSRTETLGMPVRSDFGIYGNRRLYTPYFGMGNTTGFDSDLWNEDYYYFESVSFGGEYQARIPFSHTSQNRVDVEALFTTAIGYETPRNVPEDRLFNEERPTGYEGGWLNYIGTGLIRDSRDSELNPTKGAHTRVEWKMMNSLFFSDFDMHRLDANISGYYSIGRLILAGRTAAAQIFGEVPYWKLPAVGGKESLRGYAENRFRGDGRLIYNLEMRSWFYTAELIRLRFGAHIFYDGGRILDYTSEMQDTFRDHHQTFGGGLSYQMLDSNMMLRIEAGYSGEMLRLYAGTGFMF